MSDGVCIMIETWGPGSCAERFFDLSGVEVVEVPPEKVYGAGIPSGQFLRVSYEGGIHIVYRAPLPEFLYDKAHILTAQRMLEGPKAGDKVIEVRIISESAIGKRTVRALHGDDAERWNQMAKDVSAAAHIYGMNPDWESLTWEIETE